MPTRAKIPTIKRAKWMPKSHRWVATEDDGRLRSFRSAPHFMKVKVLGTWMKVWFGVGKSGPRTKPPADPAKTLRRIRDV